MTPGAAAAGGDLRSRIVEGALERFPLPAEELVSELERELGEYVRWMQARGLSASTRRSRKVLAGQFFRAHGRWDVPGEDVAAWLDGFAGWTRVTYQQHLSSVFSWLVEVGLVEDDPMPRIRKARAPRRRPNPLTAGEVEQLRAAATSQDERAWLLLGLLAGLRCHEIAKVHGRDVTEQAIRVVGKGGLDASVPTHPALWELAGEYPRDGYWFTSHLKAYDHVSVSCVGSRVARLMRSVGLEGSIHRTRHTFATNLLRAGVNIRVVQELMRHASIETTARYLLVVEDEMTAAVHALGLGR